MRSVLVTGASGFVGAPVVEELAARGFEVHAASRSGAPGVRDGVRWHRADLADAGAVAALVEQAAPEALVHLAWYVEHGKFWDAPENVVWVERSLALLRAFAEAGGRRAVLLGTCAEYDWSGNPGPLRERDSPVRPATVYGAAKDGLRRVAQAYAEAVGIELAWARLFFMYGPREQPARLVPAVIRSLLAGESVATTRGEQVRDFMHVRDVAAALVAVLGSSLTGAVNIGSGEATKVRDVVAEIAALIGRPELVRWGELPERPEDPPSLVADAARLREGTGFEPAFGLAEGLADAIAWWRERA